MSHRSPPPRSPRTGRLAIGLALVIGLGAAAGVLMAGDGPDISASGTSLGAACSVAWPFPSAAL